jgi:hypothetical protein
MTMLPHMCPSKRILSGRLIRSTFITTRFLQKNKKKIQRYFLSSLPHAHSSPPLPAAGLLQRGGLVQPCPPCPDPARPLRLAATARPSHVAHPVEPSPVRLAMVVVVVLAWRRLRPRRLESPGPGLPHVVSACLSVSNVS